MWKGVRNMRLQDVYGNDVRDDKDENVRTFILLSTEHYFYVFICVCDYLWLRAATSTTVTYLWYQTLCEDGKVLIEVRTCFID